MSRVSVSLRYAYRLLNHGPTTLVGTRAGERTNVMAAQWVMPIDYDPPKLAVVVDGTTYTRRLLAWLECRLLRTPALDEAARAYDLFLVEAVAAWADPRYWRDNHAQLDDVRTLHHLGGGTFVASGERISGR
jgi:flavin reductase (DIM6/NTAB) family NADH-FMN oxidoreductase RutF